MKKFGLIILLLYLSTLSISAQNYSLGTVNEFEGVAESASYVDGGGGYAITSTGSLHILIIFAEFPDDNYDIYNTRWVKGSAPQNMTSWVDQTWSTNPTQGSLTHYFNVMSLNRFKITGETIHAIAPRTRKEYKTRGEKRGAIQKEILQKIDSTKDFSSFDNWTRAGYYSHVNQPDNPVGQVDMIMFVWRNVLSDSANYEKDLDFRYDYGDLGKIGSFSVDNGARTINTNVLGSGLTVRAYVGSEKYFDDPFRITMHEFAHYLLGWNDMHNGYGFWGMLCDWGTRSYVANAFERYQLGWIDNPTTYTVDANTTSNITLLSKTLDDFVTTGHAYKIIVDTASSKYFYLENHQNTSYWETHSPFSSHPNSVDGTVESGLYVVRQIGMGNAFNIYGKLEQFARLLIPADGRYSWSVVQSFLNPDGKVLPVWYRGLPNLASGYHDLEFVPHTYSYTGIENPSSIHFVRDTLYHTNTEPNYYLGDGKDAFGIGYNQVFSPWSNPNNQKAANSTTPFGFEITSFSNGIYTLNLYVNTSVDASPSKPQNLHLTYANQYHPSLGWDVNTEPDISSYKIYRNYDNGGWVSAGTVTHPTNTFVDNMIDYTKPIWEKAVKYYVVAVDNTSKTSAPSTQVETNGIMNQIPKINEENYAEEKTVDEVVHDFRLYDNYPDPFNPSTTIRYQIPESGMVTLKVYDILGKEVATLVNGNKASGYYEVNFDASKLTSGVYIYTIQSGKYTESKKMILTK